MSDSVTITADNGDTYVRQPRQRGQREARETPEVHIEAEVVTPEAAVEDARSQLQAKDRQVADARRIAREADQRRQAAEAQVVQARENQVNDRQTVVAQALDGAKSEQTSAKLAISAAVLPASRRLAASLRCSSPGGTGSPFFSYEAICASTAP